MANTKQVRNDAESVADHVSTLANDVRELSTAARRTVADGADAVRETANEYLEQGRTKARQAGERVQAQVSEKPLSSVMLAAAVGFVVGMLWVRR